MKHILVLIIILASADPAFASGKLMSFKEVEECVSLNHEIVTADMELSEEKKTLDDKHSELLALRSSMDRLKAEADRQGAEGQTNAYNRIVNEYNSLVKEYTEKQKGYEAVSDEYEATRAANEGRKKSYIELCKNRRIYMPDLRKACRETPHPQIPFCIENLESKDKE